MKIFHKIIKNTDFFHTKSSSSTKKLSIYNQYTYKPFSYNLYPENTLIDTDIIIIGGGVTAYSLANGILKGNEECNLLVIERNPEKHCSHSDFLEKKVPTSHVYSLNSGSLNYFRSVDLFSKINPQLTTYVKEMILKGSDSTECLRIKYRDDNSNSDTNTNSSNYFSNANVIYDKVKTFLKNMDESNKSTSTSTSSSSSTTENTSSDIDNNQMVNNESIFLSIEHDHLLSAMRQNVGKYSTLNNHIYDLTEENIEIDNENNEYVYLKLMTENRNKYITYRSKLIIACDGQSSIIKKKLNLKGFSYCKQKETTLYFTAKGDINTNVLHQRLFKNCFYSIIPIYDNYYSIVCIIPETDIEKFQCLSEQNILDLVNKVFTLPDSQVSYENFQEFDSIYKESLRKRENPNILTENNTPILNKIVSNLQVRPFELEYLNNSIHNNVIFIGDSAHTLHPFGGNNINLAIAETAILSNELSISNSNNWKINGKEMKNAFFTKSSISNTFMLSGTEVIRRLFKRDSDIIKRIGMKYLSNESELLKSFGNKIANGKLILPKKYNWEKDI